MDVIINIVLFFIGLVLGNWFAIGRDKRKEFNEIADKVHLVLKKEKDSLSKSNKHVYGPTADDIEMLKRRMSVFKKKGFEQALDNYRKAKTDNHKRTQVGGFLYKDTGIVIEAIKDLQKYTRRK